jgi:hypothetical protein
LDLDIRIVEVLAWVFSRFHDLEWAWMIAQCRVSNLQNRLGYLVVFAGQLGNARAGSNLKNALWHLEESGLASEGALC